MIPAYPAFNIYSRIAGRTTALGAVCVAGAANKMAEWDVEVIDENNLGKFGPRSEAMGADHECLQMQRPADVVGLYGGLTSTIPRLYEKRISTGNRELSLSRADSISFKRLYPKRCLQVSTILFSAKGKKQSKSCCRL